MKYHLVSSYTYFPYYYYLAVKSILSTQSNPEITVYVPQSKRIAMEPDNEYWQSLLEDDRIAIENVDYEEELPFFNWDCGRRPTAYIADIISYMKLYEFGGVYLDFDILAVKDISYLLRHDVYLSRHIDKDDVEHYMMMAKRHSKTIKLALECSLEKLERKDKPDWRGDPGWGATGPDAIKYGVEHSGEEIDICHEMIPFLSFLWGNTQPYDESPVEVPQGIHVLHLWGHANDTLDAPRSEHVLRRITPEWVETSISIYARLVRKTIPKEERLP